MYPRAVPEEASPAENADDLMEIWISFDSTLSCDGQRYGTYVHAAPVNDDNAGYVSSTPEMIELYSAKLS